VCRDEADFKQPLDLTHSYLRAMSPVHHKYLANIGVRSTLSISIIIASELWGLIACHGYGDVGIRVSLPIRELCRNIVSHSRLDLPRFSSVSKSQSCFALYRNSSGQSFPHENFRTAH
jgi:hypothetical protein